MELHALCDFGAVSKKDFCQYRLSMLKWFRKSFLMQNRESVVYYIKSKYIAARVQTEQ